MMGSHHIIKSLRPTIAYGQLAEDAATAIIK